MSAKVLEEDETKQSSSPSPSIITILIWAYGGELLEEFKDNDVRIVYLAGRVGSVFLGERDEVGKIHKLFDNVNKSNHKQLTEIATSRRLSKPKLMKELYKEFPEANTCKIIPNFNFDEDGNARPQSTFEFLNKYIASGPNADTYRHKVKSRKQFKIFANAIDAIDASEQFAFDDAETNQTHRLQTPVINKVYQFFDLIDAVIPITDFKIEVLDTCNYTGPLKMGDDLTSKLGYNKDFKNTFFPKGNANPTLLLSDIVGYIHSLGGKIINIIDMSCRSCKSFEELRDGITQLEDEENVHIDKAFGKQKKKKSRKTINKYNKEEREKRKRKKKRKTKRKTRRKLN